MRACVRAARIGFVCALLIEMVDRVPPMDPKKDSYAWKLMIKINSIFGHSQNEANGKSSVIPIIVVTGRKGGLVAVGASGGRRARGRRNARSSLLSSAALLLKQTVFLDSLVFG